MENRKLTIPVNGVRLVASVYSVNQHGNVNLLFLHPTGLVKETWDETIQLVTSKLPNLHLAIALDARNHGDSQLLNQCTGPFDWSLAAKDVVAVVDYLALRPEQIGQPLFIVGHSFGGNNALLSQLLAPGLATGVVVIEPIVQSASFVTEMTAAIKQRPDGDPMVANALKRRGVFDSKGQAKDSFLSKPFFQTWSAKSLDSYVEYGLYQLPDGKIALKCPPEQEAATFAAATQYGPLVYQNLAAIKLPVMVLSGEKTSMLAMKFDVNGKRIFKDEAIAMQLPNSDFHFVRGAAHMVPQEAPEATANLIVEFVTKHVHLGASARVSRL